MDQEILTLIEAANFLRISRRKLLQLMKDQKGPPGCKTAGRWLFARQLLVEWVIGESLKGDDDDPK